MDLPLRITLDSVPKYRNAQEWRPVGRATCGDAERVGDGNIIAQLCHDLSETYPADTLVEVWRGETLCFSAAPIGVWASGKALSVGEQPEHLKRARG